MSARKTPEHFIARQIAYYRARAQELDLSHHYPTPELRSAMESFAPRGRVVELACGTGIWTEEILRHPIGELLCIDAAPEMLRIHEARIDDPRVRRERHDLFGWEADDHYDAVIFAFWLSHVPPTRFAEFWATVERALTPGGRVFFVDDDHRAEADEERIPDADIPLVLRTLNDGTSHVAIKLFHEPHDLAGALTELGWDAEVHAAGHRFLWGTASRRRLGEPTRP
jgi:demethylmenaquinone methyltransferase/2-methoxy-6-polyprenyl-1,4-benzoquinol methylase